MCKEVSDNFEVMNTNLYIIFRMNIISHSVSSGATAFYHNFLFLHSYLCSDKNSRASVLSDIKYVVTSRLFSEWDNVKLFRE